METLEQKRARFALDSVNSVIPKAKEERTKYKTQLLKLPARLHSNGLGQTVAFYLSAGKDKPEWAICDWLDDWLKNREIYPKNQDLIHSIAGKNLNGDPEATYREASAEVRALAVWLKRFAEAFLGD